MILPVLFLLAAGLAQSIPCNDIAKVDFANAVIHVNRYEVVRFSGGKACTSDGTDFTKCDWAWTIKEDHVLMPEPGLRLRMLILNADHRSGSGTWDYVMILACKDGKVEEILENRYLFGARLRLLNDRQFVITSAHWRKGDAECCPSRKKQEFYTWSSSTHNFTLRNTSILKGASSRKLEEAGHPLSFLSVSLHAARMQAFFARTPGHEFKGSSPSSMSCNE